MKCHKNIHFTFSFKLTQMGPIRLQLFYQTKIYTKDMQQVKKSQITKPVYLGKENKY